MTESTSGFLDTPAKYRDAASAQPSQGDESLTLGEFSSFFPYVLGLPGHLYLRG